MPVLDDIAYNIRKAGMADAIKEGYDTALKAAGKKLWKGVLRVAASGFGKGLAITVGLALFGGAFAGGYAAYAGMMGATAVTDGILIGLSQAGNFLLGTIAGPITMAIGGTLGAVTDVRKHHNKISAEMARVEAEQYAAIRQMEEAKQAEKLQESGYTLGTLGHENPEFARRELQRRSATEQAMSNARAV